MTQRSTLLAALVVALALPFAGLAADDEAPAEQDVRKAARFRPTASVTIESTSLALGVEVSWGKGVLTFQNENHPFKTGGFNLVGLGGSSVKAEGTVFNLEKLEDFKGTWAQVSGSSVLGDKTSGVITLRNGDVYMTLTPKQKGAELAAGAGAVTIDFVDVAAEPKQAGE